MQIKKFTIPAKSVICRYPVDHPYYRQPVQHDMLLEGAISQSLFLTTAMFSMLDGSYPVSIFIKVSHEEITMLSSVNNSVFNLSLSHNVTANNDAKLSAFSFITNHVCHTISKFIDNKVDREFHEFIMSLLDEIVVIDISE